jgi:regulator of sirC expression with transglutaminase-like and TPR domain
VGANVSWEVYMHHGLRLGDTLYPASFPNVTALNMEITKEQMVMEGFLKGSKRKIAVNQQH